MTYTLYCPWTHQTRCDERLLTRLVLTLIRKVLDLFICKWSVMSTYSATLMGINEKSTIKTYCLDAEINLSIHTSKTKKKNCIKLQTQQHLGYRHSHEKKKKKKSQGQCQLSIWWCLTLAMAKSEFMHVSLRLQSAVCVTPLRKVIVTW